MTDSPWVVVPVTVLIIALSGVFVAVEFALIAAKRHRLEDAAPRSRAARAALRNSAELTLLLAGSQLGITVCTLALGAITKPAVHHWLTPALESLGLPEVAADVAAFILALFIVTFLHLVIGEMAPKSWAIAHPERSATLLSIPMRGFMFLTRPLLRALNAWANALVRRVGVEPVENITTSQNPDDLRKLVEHSISVGALDPRHAGPIEAALEMQTTPLRDLITSRVPPTQVPASATAGELRDATCTSGHLRILLNDGDRIVGVVHVRDTLAQPDDAPVEPLARPVFTLDAGTLLHESLAAMRQTRNHLALVTENGQTLGVVTLADVLRKLFPQP